MGAASVSEAGGVQQRWRQPSTLQRRYPQDEPGITHARGETGSFFEHRENSPAYADVLAQSATPPPSQRGLQVFSHFIFSRADKDLHIMPIAK